MFSIKSVYITVQHKLHRKYREYELISSMIRAALRRVTTYQIQISENNTCRHSYTDFRYKCTKLNEMVNNAYIAYHTYIKNILRLQSL